jgi:outer membrane protein TolC
MKKIILLLLIAGRVAAQDSLAFYLETAVRNSPAVMAAFHAFEASRQGIRQAGAWEDPRLETGFFPQPMTLVDGRQVAQFQLMQMFPRFGVKKAARAEARHMASMSFEQFRETRDRLLLDVYRQWYVLNRLQQQLKNSREHVNLLRQLETLTVGKFSAGGASSGATPYAAGSAPEAKKQLPAGEGMSGMTMGNAGGASAQQASVPKPSMNMSSASGNMSGSASGGMADALRIQMETIEQESNTERLLSELTAEKARFNALLNRPAKSEVFLPDTIVLIPYLLNVDEAMRLISEQNPMLGMLREEASAYRAKEEMSRKMGYPMVGVGLQYMLIGKSGNSGMTGMETAAAGMNGKDMWMPMLSVSIPVYRGKYRAAQREAQYRRQEALAKYSDELNRLEADLYRAKHELDDAQRSILLYRRQAALAHTACDLLVGEFISGKSDLSSIFQVQRQLLDYRLKVAEAVADYQIRVATIQKMIASKVVEP